MVSVYCKHNTCITSSEIQISNFRYLSSRIQYFTWRGSQVSSLFFDAKMNLQAKKFAQILLCGVIHNSLTHFAKSAHLTGRKECKCDLQMEGEARQVFLYLTCAQYVRPLWRGRRQSDNPFPLKPSAIGFWDDNDDSSSFSYGGYVGALPLP